MPTHRLFNDQSQAHVDNRERSRNFYRRLGELVEECKDAADVTVVLGHLRSNLGDMRTFCADHNLVIIDEREPVTRQPLVFRVLLVRNVLVTVTPLDREDTNLTRSEGLFHCEIRIGRERQTN